MVRGQKVLEVLERLPFIGKTATTPVKKVLNSALANAKNNLKLNPENLYVKNVLVDEGVRMKRQDRSHSMRAERGIIFKRTAHLTAVLEERSNNG